MKVEIKKKSNPFIILSLINCCGSGNNNNKNNSHQSVKRLFKMPKPSLKLFTKTFTKRKSNNKNKNDINDNNQNNDEELPYPRPLTATLDKPTILNINLISQIDMSTIRKEFLNISNLCHLPLTLTMSRKKRSKTVRVKRPLSLPSTTPPQLSKNLNSANNKNEKRPETFENFRNNNNSDNNLKNIPKKLNKAKMKRTDENGNDIDKALKKILPISDNNNNKTFRIPRKRIVNKLQNNNNDDDDDDDDEDNTIRSSSSTTISIKLPEPCKTCGRPDQPERFHSHPVTPLKPIKKTVETPRMKSTVTKPVAIKYKSKQQQQQQSNGDKKVTVPCQKLVDPPMNFEKKSISETTTTTTTTLNRCKSGKRTLTCYICGREFGTASLPLHEPKCLQKWERENANLPKHLQRSRPIKPTCPPENSHEWNENAWKSSQANLVPCPNCGRTFLPDRLIVHQKSCKSPPSNSNNNSKPPPKLLSTTAPSSPLSIECPICKRMFGKHSIKVHEKQCQKRWHLENESLRESQPDQKPSSGKSPKKPALLTCYICGKLFTISSMAIHEPQCLKKWHYENDKLPLNKRQTQPTKPEMKFTRDGKIDLDAMIEASWQSHLNQLVPCKYCSRTFNPDRVEVHERSCKGS